MHQGKFIRRQLGHDTEYVGTDLVTSMVRYMSPRSVHGIVDDDRNRIQLQKLIVIPDATAAAIHRSQTDADACAYSYFVVQLSVRLSLALRPSFLGEIPLAAKA